ncbi:5182_t:CDS:2, partial [Dentiscutata erythropus]
SFTFSIGITLDDDYFTLDHDWSLLTFLLYRQQCDDFFADKCNEHKRYIYNLSAIINSEDSPEIAVERASKSITSMRKEKKLDLVNNFWKSATSARKQKIEALCERSALVEELTTYASTDNHRKLKRPRGINEDETEPETSDTVEDDSDSWIPSDLLDDVPHNGFWNGNHLILDRDDAWLLNGYMEVEDFEEFVMFTVL